jgi:hypothetical protein
MSSEDDPLNQPSPAGPRFPLLERITAGALLAVVASLGWVLLAGSQPAKLIRSPTAPPGQARPAQVPGSQPVESIWSPTEAQVVFLLALLLAALLLVSVVALLHTRA